MFKFEGKEDIKYIEVEENITVIALKFKLSNTFDIYLSRIELLLNGQILENSQTLNQKDINDKVIILRDKKPNEISNESLAAKNQNLNSIINHENDINYDDFTYKNYNQIIQLFQYGLGGYTKEQQIKIRVKIIFDMYKKSKEEFFYLFQSQEDIIYAVIKDDKELLENIIRKNSEIQGQKQIQLNNILKYGPKNEEEKKILEEAKKRERILENMKYAEEKIPESLIPIHMPFIYVEINNKKIMALIDTGAEVSTMSEKLSKECGLFNLCDTRHQTYSIGMGGQCKIIGVVHSVQIKLENKIIKSEISIIQNNLVGFILGLDILRTYNCCLDSYNEELVFQDDGIKIKLLSVQEVKNNKKDYLYNLYNL